MQSAAFSRLVKIGGVAAILAGILLVSADAWGVITGTTSGDYTQSTQQTIKGYLFLVGVLLLVPAVTGLYLKQAEAAGRFGTVAFLGALIGSVMMWSSDWSEVFVAPIFAERLPELVKDMPPSLGLSFMVNFFAYAAGWLLFGIATFKANVYPRPAAIVLILGVVSTFAPVPWIFIIWNSALVWLGVSALRDSQPALSRQGAIQPDFQLS